MDYLFRGPRRRNICGYNVAETYQPTVAIALLIPVVVILGVGGVLLTEDYLSSHSADSVVNALLAIFVFSASSEIFLFLVTTVDPGILPPGQMTGLSHMCPICLVEVEEFDHHCPWTSACIGKGNFRYLLCFSWCVSGLCLTGFFLAFDVCQEVVRQEHIVDRVLDNKWRVVPIVLKAFTRDRASVLAALVLLLCTYTSCVTVALAAVYTFFTLTRRHALHRRRRRCPGGGVREVFSGFFHPVFTKPSTISAYRDDIAFV